ncbi:MAG: LssY C-terminal domain-containing protein [Gemmatimonadales bacterium]
MGVTREIVAVWALIFVGAGTAVAQRTIDVPAGARIPIRFLAGVRGGHDSIGSVVVVQTMGAVVADTCIVLSPYVLVQGHVVKPRHRGHLRLSFDSVAVDGAWHPIEARLDSLEFSPRAVNDSGIVTANGRRSSKVGRALVPLGVAVAAEALVVPAALASGYALIRRRQPATILAGEMGRLRLTAPLTLSAPPGCFPVERFPPLASIPPLPPIDPRTTDRAGNRPGDPINLLFLGPADRIDSAFVQAGWRRAMRGSFFRLSREIAAMLMGRPGASAAPVSRQYLDGRRQDLAFEFGGHSATARHHLRLWLVDSLRQVWVAAATRDNGLFIRPFRGTATHRINPAVDLERDLIVRELIASDCAALAGYVTLPGAVTDGKNAAGQRFSTDGRAAVIEVRSCGAAPVTDPEPPL